MNSVAKLTMQKEDHHSDHIWPTCATVSTGTVIIVTVSGWVQAAGDENHKVAQG